MSKQKIKHEPYPTIKDSVDLNNLAFACYDVIIHFSGGNTERKIWNVILGRTPRTEVIFS